MFDQNWLLGFLFCQDVHVADQAFGKISVEVVGTYVLAAQCSRQIGFLLPWQVELATLCRSKSMKKLSGPTRCQS